MDQRTYRDFYYLFAIHYSLLIYIPNHSSSDKNRNSGFSNSCQPDGELCFNAGGDDVFCCSGKCGSNRRCKSSNTGSNDVAIDFNVVPTPAVNPTPKSTRRPTKSPTKPPVTEKPTRKSSRKPQSSTQSSPVFTAKNADNGCDSGEVKVTVEIKTDKWGAGKWFPPLICYTHTRSCI